jgi:glutaminyl-tRNA synthetase
VVLTNFPAGETEWFEAANHPQDPEMGSRQVPMTREIFIEQDDFMEEAPKKFFRLKPGGEVRLRGAFIIRCDEVDQGRGRQGDRTALQLRPRLAHRPARRRPQGQGHDSLGLGRTRMQAEVRLYDRLFNVPTRAATRNGTFVEHVNP